jgi:hypothetical protein
MTIVLKGYCDGSGHPDDPNTPFLTLAGLIAPTEAWDRFGHEWSATLDDHGSKPWHSKDAHGRAKDFAGWSEERVRALRNDLYRRCFEKIAWEEQFVHAACTVDCEGYERARVDMPWVNDVSPVGLCANWFVNTASSWLVTLTKDPSGQAGDILLFFDRGERFHHHVQREWERRKWNPNDILSRISATPRSLDYREFPPIQAADFLAWHTNRGLRNWQGEQASTMMSWFGAPRHAITWDYEMFVRADALKRESEGASG